MSSTVTLHNTSNIHSKDEEEKRSGCKEPKCKLVTFDSLPDYLKDNEFVVNYYRCEWSLKKTILSIFSIHNETLNVWTHLIGFFIFLAITILYVPTIVDNPMMQPQADDVSNNVQILGCMIALPCVFEISQHPKAFVDYFPENFLVANQTDSIPLISAKNDAADMGWRPEPITRWPFYAFLIGAMFCLFTSSACHLLICHSERCAYAMLRLDYIGISTLIVTSFYPLVYYTFMCDPLFCSLYIGFITVSGLATILVSLVPVFQTAKFRTVRALLFFTMGFSGLVPIMHKVVAFGHRTEALVSTCYELLMGLFYAVGVVVYVTRVPERWMPGKFDLVGHSHQLFHVLVVAGAYTHYLAGLVYLQWRDTEGC